ncbi:hypothetical protein C1637_08445 [Chryseobacterium lactis]|uniref:Uncharacterized protein n=2 Tax=Chryseobacterium lactis TaxID=1241981 RepID=A0A3G6RLU0_CHRLC|nr:hypothetical protein EG342_11250 [Chryseobacterium lactis]AZB02816.1 hypothetical protein EG341_02110 [Chryseobacterium lactis]PNW13890.1 hypothetical protein C1637_08445 [Chryseobacterium lactis]
MQIAMKLDEIIKAVRIGTINELLDDYLRNIDYDKIIVYAEHTVSTDTNYRFFQFKRGLKEILKEEDMWYERLCSLKELSFLVNFFLRQYDRKTDDILAIEIIDYLYNHNF